MTTATVDVLDRESVADASREAKRDAYQAAEDASVARAVSRYLYASNPSASDNWAIVDYVKDTGDGRPVRLLAFTHLNLPPVDNRDTEFLRVNLRKSGLARELDALGLGRRLDTGLADGLPRWLKRVFRFPRRNRFGELTGKTKSVRLGSHLGLRDKREIDNMVVYKIRHDWDVSIVDALLSGDSLFVRCGICEEYLEDMPRAHVVQHFKHHADQTALYCEFCEWHFNGADEAAEHVASGCALVIDYDSDYEDEEDDDDAGQADETEAVEAEVDLDANEDAQGMETDDSGEGPAEEDYYSYAAGPTAIDVDGTAISETNEDGSRKGAETQTTRCHSCAEMMDIADHEAVMYHATGQCR